MTGGVLFVAVVLFLIGISKVIFHHLCVVYELQTIKSKLSKPVYNWLAEKEG